MLKEIRRTEEAVVLFCDCGECKAEEDEPYDRSRDEEISSPPRPGKTEEMEICQICGEDEM